jgi:hypothetical protein
LKSLDKLRKLAFEKRQLVRRTKTRDIHIEGLKIHFPCASLQQIKNSQILTVLEDNSYLNKPAVAYEGRIVFGELAVLRYLEKDQWKGVWVDTAHSHGRKDVLWAGMPPTGVARAMPTKVSEKFQAIKAANGDSLAGFFDIFAWKGEGEDFIFVEYKAKGENVDEREYDWINAAMAEGVEPQQMCVVGYDLPS